MVNHNDEHIDIDPAARYHIDASPFVSPRIIDLKHPCSDDNCTHQHVNVTRDNWTKHVIDATYDHFNGRHDHVTHDGPCDPIIVDDARTRTDHDPR